VKDTLENAFEEKYLKVAVKRRDRDRQTMD
jgi:hypothetical protein